MLLKELKKIVHALMITVDTPVIQAAHRRLARSILISLNKKLLRQIYPLFTITA